MSWTNEDGDHEGWAAAEMPGGWFSVGSTAAGITVRRFAPGPLRDQHAGEPPVRDGREAIGWRGLCECGWRGQLWERVERPEQADPAARRVHDPDPSPNGYEPADVEDAIHAEWKAHLLPAETLLDLRMAADRVSAAKARLTDAVRAAHQAGNSWADIARNVGISRQSAHERWAKHMPPPVAELAPLATLLEGRGFAPLPHDGATARWLLTTPGRPDVRVSVGPDDRIDAGTHRVTGPAVVFRDEADGKDCVLGSLHSPQMLPMLTGILDTTARYDPDDPDEEDENDGLL
jgi:hypothetical protein